MSDRAATRSADQLAIAAIDQAATFIAICDADLKPVFLNRAGRQMVGLPHDADISGFAVADFFVPEHRPVIERIWLPAVVHDGRWEGELKLRHFSETLRETEVRWSTFGLYDDVGSLVGAAAIVSDISAPKRTDRGLEESQALLSRIIENLPLGVGVYGHSGHLLQRNQEFARWAGVSVRPSLGPAARQFWQGFTLDGQRLAPEDFLHSGHGEPPRWTRVSAVSFPDEGSSEAAAILVIQDVHDQKTAIEEFRRSEARLRAAGDLVGLAVYSWDPVNDTLEWDDRVRAMWGLPAGEPIDMEIFYAGIHPDDRARVKTQIAACVDPAGDGRYEIEYRVIGRDDGVERCIATSGQTTFEQGRATDFIGAAVDVTEQRRADAAIRRSEQRFRTFAQHSTNLLWIADPNGETIEYRSPAYKRIWGEPIQQAPRHMEDWLKRVHPDDIQAVSAALDGVEAGEVVQYQYRIVRSDRSVRWLRDTSFPIRDEAGHVVRIGGITEDLTWHDGNQIYLIGAGAGQTRKLANVLRSADFQVRVFESAGALLDIASVLAPGCVLVDLRGTSDEGTVVPRELKARSVALPSVLIGPADADAASIIGAMKAGAADYLLPPFGDDDLNSALASALAELHGVNRVRSQGEEAAARVGRLTPREREVLSGLVNGGTNKTIGQELGISPRTVELHRAQVMNRLNAGSLPELIQVALAAGICPTADGKRKAARLLRRSST